MAANLRRRQILLRIVTFMFVFSCISAHTLAQSQNLYTYHELSKVFYEKKRDSLKKAWQCPDIYKDKATQKLYKEIWDGRTRFITDAIDENGFVQEKDIYKYVDGIIDELVKGNSKLITEKPTLFIDRSSSANAYAVGGNIIAVNLGLLTFAATREEIALVIAHELSHNLLNHAENAMKERAEFFTSEEYKASLNAVLDSKYERVTRLKKVFEGYSFDRSKHQRYHESDADSLAIILLKNANISFNPAAYLRLDSCDLQYHHPLKQPVKTYFAAFDMPVEDGWLVKKTRGLSTKSYNFKDSSGLADSLKTHPDCEERYKKTLAMKTSVVKETVVPGTIKDKAMKMIIWNLFDGRNLTACMYRILLEKDKGSTDKWYDFMVNNIVHGLYYSDKELERFNAIRVKPKEYISADYYQLQNMFEQMPGESLDTYCKSMGKQNFWQELPADARAFKNLFQSLVYNERSDKAKDAAAKDFMSAYESSMYCEFAEHFRKK